MARSCWGVGLFVRLDNLCYNDLTMEENTVSTTESVTEASAPPEPAAPETLTPPEPAVPVPVELSPAELQAQKWLRIGLVIAALFLISVITLLVFLSVDAYQAASAGQGPSPGEVVVGVLRDAAIIFVAFETLLIGILMIVLMIQVQSLVVLLRDEIKPMLESANETLATVRGTTQFVSHNVVSPVMKWSGYLAGLRRIVREVRGLSDSEE